MIQSLGDLRVALARVFARLGYAALAGALAAVAFVLAVWAPNLGLLAEVFAGAQTPFGAKLGIALSLLGGIGTNFSALSAGYTVAIAVLFGMTAAMIVFLLRRRRLASAARDAAVGSGGVASGIVGIGCAACGSLILGGLVPSLGMAGALATLPLQGEEFGILSVALLFTSLLFVSKGIAEPLACALAQGGTP